MKTEKINFITIASSSNYKVSKEQEEFENKILTQLYEQYKEKPFNYAIVNYSEKDTPNITIVNKQKLITQKITKFVTKISKIFRKKV